MMTSGKRFYARDDIDCLTVHACELPSIAGVRDQDDETIGWEEIFSVMSLRWRTFSLRFQARLRE